MTNEPTTGPATDPDNRMPLEPEAKPETGGIAGAMSYVPATKRDPSTCFVCGGPFKGGASYGAQIFPGVGIVQSCSLACHNLLPGDPWLAGYEAAKKQAADALEKAATEGFPSRATDRLRTAKMIRGMVPKR